MKENINQRIEIVQQYSKLSVLKFAESIGISQPSAKAIIDGKNAPSFKAIEGIAIGYPIISAEWLLRGEGDMLRTVPGAKIDDITKQLDEALNETRMSDSIIRKMIKEEVEKEVKKQLKKEA